MCGWGYTCVLMTLFSERDTERPDHWGRVGVGLRRRLPETKVNASGAHGIMGQRFKIKGGQRPALWRSSWRTPGDCAAAACVSQRMIFWVGGESLGAAPD